jgi:DNA repair exonuclease SbcCD ATPase subunit
MSQNQVEREKVSVYVENIGGINNTSVSIPPGVTILTGRNATNRTSLLRAIMAGMGSNDVAVKGDAEIGSVQLSFSNSEYTRTIEKKGKKASFSGDPYLANAEVADLFAFLLESNEARQAVMQGQNLSDLLMRPVDTEAIKHRIQELKQERKEIEDQIENLKALKDELPSLESKKTELESDIENKKENLAALKSKLEDIDGTIDQKRDNKQELDNYLEELDDVRSTLESVRSDIDLQEESLESLRKERTELKEKQEELPHSPVDDAEQIDRQIAEHRDEIQDIETTVSNLQDIIQFNEQMLSGEQSAVTEAPTSTEQSDDSITDQLVDQDKTVCWTCGSDITKETIEETLDNLRKVRKEYMDDVNEIEDSLDSLQEKKERRQKHQQQRERIEADLADIEDEIDRRESRLESLRDQREELITEVEELEAEAEKLESEDFSEILSLHKEANQLEFEIEDLESELEAVTDRITSIEDELSKESELSKRSDQVKSELKDQRTKIDQIERNAVQEFNDRMEEILDILEYDNISRIWVERVQRTEREGRRKVDKTHFELHVVRTTSSGTTYEDVIDHLSESEREVMGLTFALAGYLVHDLYTESPFMLLDSLEAIDSARIADLVSYFSEFVPYLVIALLPEDAQALPADFTRIREI